MGRQKEEIKPNDEKVMKMLEENINLLYYLVQKHRERFNSAEEFEDFLGYCEERYVRFLANYDESLGYQLSSYLNTVVRNAYRQFMRNKYRKKRYAESVSLDSNVSVFEDETCLVDIIADKKNTDVHMKLLCDEVLKELEGYKYKEWFILRFFYGYKFEDIAKKAGCTRQFVCYAVNKKKDEICRKYKSWFYDIME